MKLLVCAVNALVTSNDPVILAFPLTVNPVNVPTLVKLLVTTFVARVVPVNVFAGATDDVAA